MQKADEWTIDRWKTEPRISDVEYLDSTIEPAPPLWKDLTLASVVAAVIWLAAALVFA